jgi:hypothetical protein
MKNKQLQKQNTGVLRSAQDDKICWWYEREQATTKTNAGVSPLRFASVEMTDLM